MHPCRRTAQRDAFTTERMSTEQLVAELSSKTKALQVGGWPAARALPAPGTPLPRHAPRPVTDQLRRGPQQAGA